MDKSEEFVVTGIKKYLDAISAVKSFEKEIQLRVKSLVDRRQPELSEFLGGRLSLDDYLWSSELPKRVQIGQRVPFKGLGLLYFYLEFTRDDSDNSCTAPAVSFNRNSRNLLTSLWDAVELTKAQSTNENLGCNKDAIWTTSSKPCTDWESCKSVFDEVIDDWIGLWKTLGGITKYLVN